MTLQIPEPLQWLAYLTGSQWPQGDESAMFRIGECWHEAADELEALIPELDQVSRKTGAVLTGETAAAAQANFALLFDGDYSVEKLVEAMSAALGELARNVGTQIEYTKLQIITSLAIAGAEITYALACAPSTFGASLSWIPPIEAITMAAVRQLVAQLLKRLAGELAKALTLTGVKRLFKHAAKEAVQGTLEEAAQELAIQEIQKSKGHRDGIDWKQVGKNAAGGAAGGATGGATHGPLKHALGDSSSVLGKATKGALTGYGSGVVGNVFGSIASEGGLTAGGLDPLSVFGGASTQAISGALHGTGHPHRDFPAGGPGGLRPHGDLQLGEPAPGEKTDPTTSDDHTESGPSEKSDASNKNDISSPPNAPPDHHAAAPPYSPERLPPHTAPSGSPATNAMSTHGSPGGSTNTARGAGSGDAGDGQASRPGGSNSSSSASNRGAGSPGGVPNTRVGHGVTPGSNAAVIADGGASGRTAPVTTAAATSTSNTPAASTTGLSAEAATSPGGTPAAAPAAASASPAVDTAGPNSATSTASTDSPGVGTANFGGPVTPVEQPAPNAGTDFGGRGAQAPPTPMFGERFQAATGGPQTNPVAPQGDSAPPGSTSLSAQRAEWILRDARRTLTQAGFDDPDSAIQDSYGALTPKERSRNVRDVATMLHNHVLNGRPYAGPRGGVRQGIQSTGDGSSAGHGVPSDHQHAQLSVEPSSSSQVALPDTRRRDHQASETHTPTPTAGIPHSGPDEGHRRDESEPAPDGDTATQTHISGIAHDGGVRLEPPPPHGDGLVQQHDSQRDDGRSRDGGSRPTSVDRVSESDSDRSSPPRPADGHGPVDNPSDTHIRRAVDAVLPRGDVEEVTRPEGTGEASGSRAGTTRSRANPLGLVVALGKATTAYKDLSQHDDAAFMRLLREELTDPESGKTVLASLMEDLDDLNVLVKAHPRRALSESQQTAYRVLRNSAGSIIDKALGSVQALSRDESLLNRAGHFALTLPLLAAPYAVPLLHDPPSFNFISLTAASEMRAVLRMGGMARHSAYSGRLLSSTIFDLVLPWSVPGLTYLLPAVVPSLHEQQTDPRWAAGSGLVQAAIFFGLGFPKLFPYLADKVISFGTAVAGLPLPVTEHRALARGELRLLSDSDARPPADGEAAESQQDHLTQEALTRAIAKVRSHFTTIETAKRMFEERGSHVSDNTDRQISLVRSDILHLERLGAQLVDATAEAGASTGRGNVDFWPKLGFVIVTGVVRGVAAGASLTDPLSASDILPATAFLMTRSIVELRDPNVTQRDAATTFNNFTPPGMVAMVPNVANLVTQGRIFESADSALPWIGYLLGANATWGNWVGEGLSHGVSKLIEAGQRNYPGVRDKVKSWLPASGAPQDTSDGNSSTSDVEESQEAMGAAGVPGGFSADTGHPPHSQSTSTDPLSPSGSTARTDPLVAPEHAGPTSDLPIDQPPGNEPTAHGSATPQIGVRGDRSTTHADRHTPEPTSSVSDTEDDVADYTAGADHEPDITVEDRFPSTTPIAPVRRQFAGPLREGPESSSTVRHQAGGSSLGGSTTRRIRFLDVSSSSGSEESLPDLGTASGSGNHPSGNDAGTPQAGHPYRPPPVPPRTSGAGQRLPGSRQPKPNWLASARRGPAAEPGVSFLDMPGSRGDHVMARDVPGFEPDREVDADTRALAREALRRRAAGADSAFLGRNGLVDANAIRHPLDDAARGVSTARLNARWWQGLSEEQRRAMITSYPDQVGNAEGLPPQVRDEANRRVLKDTLAREEADNLRLIKPIKRMDAVNSALRRAARRMGRIGGGPPMVLAFDPEAFYRDGRILVAVGGDPYRASSVSWIVPGMTTTMASLDDLLNDAVNLVESARTEGAADAVSLVWIGYDAPSGWRSGRVTSRSAAKEGGEILHADIKAFNAGRDAAANDDSHFSSNHVFGHSYGSTTTGYAGRNRRLAGQIQTVTLLGSPGAGPIWHANEFGIGRNVFVAGSSRDPVTALGRTPDTNASIGQGIDPTLRDFGARRLASEFPRSADTVATAATHVSYYHYVDKMGPRSQSLKNFGRIVAGQHDRLDEHDHRVDGQPLLAMRRTFDPAADPSASRRWWDPSWASLAGSRDVSSVARVEDSAAQQLDGYPSSGPPHAAEPNTTPELRFREKAKKLKDSEIEIVHARASEIADQAAKRYWSDPNATRLVVHVEVGGNGRRWPFDGWPFNGRAKAVGQTRATETRKALETEVHRLLDQRGVPRSMVTFREESRGKGLPDNNGTPHDLDSDEVARRVVVIRTEEAVQVSDRPIHIGFAARGKHLGDVQEHELEPFIAHVVDEAARRHAANEGGLVVHVDGGGNGGNPFRGADAVGLKRARATNEYLKKEVAYRLGERQIDTDMVTFSEPTSRGRSLLGGAPVTGNLSADAAARRTVEVRLEDVPSTTDEVGQHASMTDQSHSADPASSGLERHQRTAIRGIGPSRPTRPAEPQPQSSDLGRQIRFEEEEAAEADASAAPHSASAARTGPYRPLASTAGVHTPLWFGNAASVDDEVTGHWPGPSSLGRSSLGHNSTDGARFLAVSTSRGRQESWLDIESDSEPE